MTDRAPGGATRLDTARLRLTALRVEDADEMIAVLSDPGLYAFTGGEAPTIDELRDRYRHQVVGPSADGEEWRNWIVRLADGTAIGFVQATIVDGGATADVAWVIGVPWQGHGYASEAGRALVAWLEAHGVGRITAHVHPDHDASGRVAAAIGLRPTDAIEDGEQVWAR